MWMLSKRLPTARRHLPIQFPGNWRTARTKCRASARVKEKQLATWTSPSLDNDHNFPETIATKRTGPINGRWPLSAAEAIQSKSKTIFIFECLRRTFLVYKLMILISGCKQEWTYVIFVEDAKDQRGELGWITLREELLVDPYKSLNTRTKRINKMAVKALVCRQSKNRLSSWAGKTNQNPLQVFSSLIRRVQKWTLLPQPTTLQQLS